MKKPINVKIIVLILIVVLGTIYVLRDDFFGEEDLLFDETLTKVTVKKTVEKQTKAVAQDVEQTLTYAVVDTGQTGYYDNDGRIKEPAETDAFYGQDAQYTTHKSDYTDNGDGTITDNVTGLMWQQDALTKQTYDDALKSAENLNLGGYDDWRMPTIKELYSLIYFNGETGTNVDQVIPYLDDDYFTFYVGDETAGERYIDAQYMSKTKYVGTTMNGSETVFGVNFVDGRIKGYGLVDPRTRSNKPFYTLFVRGNVLYGENQFIDNNDGTITDLATGLMWLESDSGVGMDWEAALIYAKDMTYAGYEDWKLPDAKELQSIVDYTRSPSTTNSAAINAIFESSEILDEGGNVNYPFYWSSTTHLDGRVLGKAAVYVAFGEALGFMDNPRSDGVELMDVHGAGAQRSDPKEGSASDYPEGLGPQGDVRRIDNYVRLVRVADTIVTDTEPSKFTVESNNDFGLILIGTGSPVPSDERSGPSTLVYYNDHYFLVDMGEGTQDQLITLGINTGDIETLMFTHHHLDHNEEYVGVLITGWLKGRNHLNLVGPSGTRALHEFVVDFYEEDMAYRAEKKERWSWNGMKTDVDFIEVSGAVGFPIEGVDITTIDVNHTIATQAYRFEADGKSIVISGDLKYSETLIALAKDADVLVIDSGSIIKVGSKGNGSGTSNEDGAHATLQEVAQMASEANVKKLILTHIGGEIDASAEIEEIKKIYNGEVIIGEDLMVIEASDQ